MQWGSRALINRHLLAYDCQPLCMPACCKTTIADCCAWHGSRRPHVPPAPPGSQMTDSAAACSRWKHSRLTHHHLQLQVPEPRRREARRAGATALFSICWMSTWRPPGACGRAARPSSSPQAPCWSTSITLSGVCQSLLSAFAALVECTAAPALRGVLSCCTCWGAQYMA